MRAARFMKWGGGPVAGAATLASFMIGLARFGTSGLSYSSFFTVACSSLVMALLVVLACGQVGARYGGPLPKGRD